jgi:hypothetical protein
LLQKEVLMVQVHSDCDPASYGQAAAVVVAAVAAVP